MTEEKQPRKVDLFATSVGGSGSSFGPPITPPTAEERLEELIKQANLLGPENNQNGGGRKNSDKGTRAARRAKKLARKKQRYR